MPKLNTAFTCVGTGGPLHYGGVLSDDCVATRVVTSIRHWIVLFYEMYWLAGVGGRG